MLLKRDEILAANDMVFEDVEVPEWGGCVRVRLMSGAARAVFDAWAYASRGNQTEWMRRFRFLVCVLCIVDADGKLMFSEADVEILGDRSTDALSRVFRVAARLNKLLPEQVEDSVKNSESGQSSDSGTD